MLINELYYYPNMGGETKNASNYYHVEIPYDPILRINQLLINFLDEDYYRPRGTLIIPSIHDKLDLFNYASDNNYKQDILVSYYMGYQIRFFKVDMDDDNDYHISKYRENEDTWLISIFVDSEINKDEIKLLNLLIELSGFLCDIYLEKKMDLNMLPLPKNSDPTSIMLFIDYYLCIFNCVYAISNKKNYKDFYNELNNDLKKVFNCWVSYFGSDDYFEEIFNLAINGIDKSEYIALATELYNANLKRFK